MNETWWLKESDLDDDQKMIISLNKYGKYLILGPPGSGKTNLLLLRANYLCMAGMPNVLILTFNRALKEFIVSGAHNYSFSPDKVQTYIGWAKRILEEHGIPHIASDNFDIERESVLSKLKYLVNIKKEINEDFYDAIFIDEAHDYSEQEISLIFKFSQNIFSVADLWQKIYKKDCNSVDYIKKHSILCVLKYHYRNGREICRFADLIMAGKTSYSPLEPTSHYDEATRPSSIKFVKRDSIDAQIDSVIECLETQRQAYPDEHIGIISPCRESIDSLRISLIQSRFAEECVFQTSESGYSPFNDKKLIYISTLHSAKGLEFRAVHIIACESLRKFSLNRNMIYTGITRAKTSLSLYYTGNLLGYIEKAMASLNKMTKTPSIEELFGHKK